MLSTNTSSSRGKNIKNYGKVKQQQRTAGLCVASHTLPWMPKTGDHHERAHAIVLKSDRTHAACIEIMKGPPLALACTQSSAWKGQNLPSQQVHLHRHWNHSPHQLACRPPWQHPQAWVGWRRYATAGRLEQPACHPHDTKTCMLQAKTGSWNLTNLKACAANLWVIWRTRNSANDNDTKWHEKVKQANDLFPALLVHSVCMCYVLPSLTFYV